MIMKRTILVLTALIAVNVASAQFFVKAGLGYNFSALSAPYVAENFDTAGNVTSSNSFTHSFGNGSQFQAALGYDFNENLGFQVGVGYGLTTKALEYSETAGAFTNARKIQTKGLLLLAPAFTLSSNSDRLNLYSRVGLTLPLAGTTNFDVVRTSSTQQFDNKTEIEGRMSIGYNAAIGTSFPLSDKLSIFAELNGTFLDIARDKLTVTQVFDKTNNQELLDTRDFIDNNRVYVESISATDNQDRTQARKVLNENAPFSTIGVAAGIKFSFGNSREDRREEKK